MLYRVKALASGGALTVLRLEAPTRAQAGHMARDRGLNVISIRADLSPAQWLAHRGERVALLLFAQQLVTLLDAGLGTVEALEAMARETSRSSSQTLRALLTHVRAGRSLSFAMDQIPAAFPPLFVATIRASERTGDLQEALGRFVSYQQQVDRLRGKVVNASSTRCCWRLARWWRRSACSTWCRDSARSTRTSAASCRSSLACSCSGASS